MTERVFYASETWPQNAAEFTAFSVQYATKRAIDLT
jgi:hypothetical protein